MVPGRGIGVLNKEGSRVINSIDDFVVPSC